MHYLNVRFYTAEDADAAASLFQGTADGVHAHFPTENPNGLLYRIGKVFDWRDSDSDVPSESQ